MKKGGIKNLFKKINWNALFLSALAVYATEILGALFTMRGVKSFWYSTVRPSITPPNWVFLVVWNILFFMIFVSLYLYLKKLKNRRWPSNVELLYSINLVLNFLWSFFYFWIRNPIIAFVDLILLWISIAILICLNWKSNRTSALLLIPYLLWISFAGVLNYLSVFV